MNDLQMQAANRFRAAIRPIYGATAKSIPYHIGSAVLLELRGVNIVLTAAHVVDQNDDATTTLYLGGETSLVEIEAEFIRTSKPAGIRDLDKLDFAAAVVPAGMLVQLGKVGWVDEADIITNADCDNLFSAVGFPNTMNKRFDARRNVVYPKLFVYSSLDKRSPEIVAGVPETGRHHIFIGYKKHSRGTDGTKVSSTGPRGLSGGAVIDTGRMSLEILRGVSMPVPRLAAIIIERWKQHQVLVCTRMSAILPVLLTQLGAPG
jgi:hypothetical protein